jgi:hypothetical protein
MLASITSKEIPKTPTAPGILCSRFPNQCLHEIVKAPLNIAFRSVAKKGLAGDACPEHSLGIIGNLPEDRLANDLFCLFETDPFLDSFRTETIDDYTGFVRYGRLVIEEM